MHRLLYTVLVLATVSLAASQSIYDSNPLVEQDLAMLNETYMAMGYPVACCPKIVHPPESPANVSTVIQSVPGYRGNAAVIVWYGTCSVEHRGYSWSIYWGDGAVDRGTLGPLLQVQKLHQYAEKCRSYRVTVHYCSQPEPSSCHLPCCDTYSRVIDVSYNWEH